MTNDMVELQRIIVVATASVIEIAILLFVIFSIRKSKKLSQQASDQMQQSIARNMEEAPVYNPTDTRPYLTHESMQAELNNEIMLEQQNDTESSQAFFPTTMGRSVEKKEVSWYLVGLEGYFKGQRLLLEGIKKIGRDASRCEIVYPVDYKGISGLHCSLEVTPEGVRLSDCNSSYGTFLNETEQLGDGKDAFLHDHETFFLVRRSEEFRVVAE